MKENNNKSWIDDINLPKDYVLSDKDEYMNDLQLKYFYNKLLEWRTQLIMELEHLGITVVMVLSMLMKMDLILEKKQVVL